MSTIPVADARANLSRLIDEASSTHERVEITKNGRRAAVLLGADDYDAMRETIAILSDPAQMQAFNEGLSELRSGKFLTEDELREMMRSTGRLGDA